MDAIKKLQSVACYSEDTTWETVGCQGDAIYICQSHKNKIICSKCKKMKHSLCKKMEYCCPNDLIDLAWELNIILVHVDTDCNKLIEDFKVDSFEVEDIRLQLKNHAKDVGALTKRVLSWLNSSKAEYRTRSSKLYKEVEKARDGLKKCKMVTGPYTDLFIPHHITDMSIVPSRKI